MSLASRTKKVTRGVDAAAILTVYICLLLGIPSSMVVAPLGTAGAPSTIMAIGTLFWWAWFQVHRSRPTSAGFQPVRAAMVGWLIIILAAYAHAMSSPIPGD